MSNVALIIPARLGSTRLARKALADIEGQPMVVRVAEQASKVRGISRILIATDSEEIIRAVKKAGFEGRMTPESLKSGTDRVAYVAKDLSEEVIVNLQGDEPVCPPQAVEAAMVPVLQRGCKMGSVFTPFHSIEEVNESSNVKVITDQNGDAIYFSRYGIPYRQNPISDDEILESPNFGKHLGIYVYQRDFLLEFSTWEPTLIERAESLEQLRAIYRGIKIGMGKSVRGSQSVDTESDLKKAIEIFRENREQENRAQQNGEQENRDKK